MNWINDYSISQIANNLRSAWRRLYTVYQRIRYGDSLRAGRLERLRVPPRLLFNGTGILSREEGKAAGAGFNHLNPVLRLRMSGVRPPCRPGVNRENFALPYCMLASLETGDYSSLWPSCQLLRHYVTSTVYVALFSNLRLSYDVELLCELLWLRVIKLLASLKAVGIPMRNFKRNFVKKHCTNLT